MSDDMMPKRWSVGNYDGYMVERDGGDYVEAEDVEPLAAEITRLRAENIHLRRAGMDRPSAELHEAALAELRDQISNLRAEVLEQARLLGMSGEREAKSRARVDVLERALRRIQATPHPSVAAQCTGCHSHQKTATYALEDAAP